MNDILDDQEYLNKDITLTVKDEKFFLHLQKLGLLVKGDDLNSTYQELMQKKIERLGVMKELNIDIPVDPSRGTFAQGFKIIKFKSLIEFFLKTLIIVFVLLGVGGVIVSKLGDKMEPRLSEVLSMLKRNANDLATMPIDILKHQVVPHYANRIRSIKPVLIIEKVLHEEAIKKPMEAKRQEKIIKDLRLVVNRLEPFIEEIRPLFKR
jgi:hypothetical protein